jgi:hypothetical protein
MPKYTEIENNFLMRENDNGSVTFIRMDDDNPEYQAYLNPEAKQSTPSVTNGD